MIEVENLTKFYGPRQAIKNLNFKVEQGEIVGFLGPNGAGKSTTMNILCCIMPASSGTARICGNDIFHQSLEVRKLIGYLPENPPIYPDMVVADFLAFAARIRLVPKKEIPDAVKRVLEKCSIEDVGHRLIGKLSRGYQQRVGLAQALVHNPEILIMDEPTSGLDPIQIIEIRKLIKELAAAHTIILSSHILPEVTQLCQRVIIINEGEIAAMDSLEGLNASMNKNVKMELTVRNPVNGIMDRLNALENVISVHQENPDRFMIECGLGHPSQQDEVARLALENDWGIVELKLIKMTLEDVFLKLTTEESEVAL